MLTEIDIMIDEMQPLGKYLRRERELKKISLGEVSKNTRVRGPILKAIEEDRYDLLPSPIFVKGFLTSYAKYVGLDSNDIVHGYQAVLKSKLDTSSDVPPKGVRRGRDSTVYRGFIVVESLWLVSLSVIFLSIFETITTFSCYPAEKTHTFPSSPPSSYPLLSPLSSSLHPLTQPQHR
jgi:cytoskeletal protein RodZ